MRYFAPIILLLLMAATASALEITAPQAQTYNASTIDVSVTHNETLDSISYSLDEANATEACLNCSSFSGQLILADGEHDLVFIGVLGNDTFEDDVTFTINTTPAVVPEDNETDDNETGENETDDEPVAMDFTIKLSPTGTVDDVDVDAKARANETLDNLSLSVEGTKVSCADCDKLELELEGLEEGEYDIVAVGVLANLTKTFTASFTVKLPEDDDENETDDDEDDGDNESSPRFAVDFNQLPKDVEDGRYTDAELASIIRNNDLNPGVVNRLIKTGMLGNESIEALLDYDFQPKGVFGKMFYNMGFKGKTYASQISKRYRLNETVQAALEEHPDLSKGQAKHQEREREREEEGKPDKVSPGQAKKGLAEGEHGDDVPLVKQDGSGQGKGGGNGKPDKVSPGQAKKGD